MNTKYVLGSLFTLPFLPVLYLQGRQIKAKVPKLPEAKGTAGTAGKQPGKVLRMLAIGESTIAGVGVETHEEGFTGTLARELSDGLKTQLKWKVYARSGFTARRVGEKIIPSITESSADLIVVGLGGNDAFTLNTPGRWRAHVQELIDAIRSKFSQTPIVFTNMPPIKEFPAFTSLIKLTIGNLVEILGEELANLIKDQKGVYYHSRVITLEDWVDLPEVKSSPADFFSDGVHPSKLTYQLWAKDFSAFMMDQEEIKSGLLQKMAPS